MLHVEKKSRLLYLSIAGALLTMALKFTGYMVTGSVGIFSDAAESIVNLLASVVALLALTIASRPPDSTHTYGHEKAEYFSSGVEGTLIVVAAVGIFYSAIKRLLEPQALAHLSTGMFFVAAAALLNLGIALVLLRAARTFDSITLEADAHHLLTDVLTSAGVIAGLGAVHLTGWYLLDPLLALLIGAHIIRTGMSLLRRSVDGLMDYRLPQKEIAAVESVLRQFQDELVAYHNLRTRKSGPKRFIEFHLLVPGKMTVQASHDLCEKIEKAIQEKLSNCEIIIHVEPSEDHVSWDVRDGAGEAVFGKEEHLPQKRTRHRNSPE